MARWGIAAAILSAGALLPLHVHLQMAAFVVGWAMVVLPLVRLAHFHVARHAEWAGPFPTHSPILALVVITLIAFGLRVVNLEDSMRVFIDEVHFVEGIIHLGDDPQQPLLRQMNAIASFPRIFAYGQAGFVSVFGSTFTGLRLLSAFVGTLTIAAAYVMGAAFVDRRAGLLAALVLALFPPHIHLSRVGLNNIADPLFGTLMLAYFMRGVRRVESGRGDGRVDFALAGAMLGLTQYFYEGGKLVYPGVLVIWGGSLLLRRAFGESRVSLRHFRPLVQTALLVFWPLLLTLLRYGERYMPRLEAVPDGLEMMLSPGQFGDYIETMLVPALTHYVTYAETPPVYYGGQYALVMPYLLPVASIGLMIVIRRGGWILPVMAIAVGFGNSLVNYPAWSVRYIMTFPALALVIACGVLFIWRMGARWLPADARIRRTVAAVGLAVLLLPMPRHYFVDHLPLYNQQIRPGDDFHDVFFRAQAFPVGTNVVVLTQETFFVPHIPVLLRWLDLDVTVEIAHPQLYTDRAPNALPTGGDLAIFVEPEDGATLAHLARAFALPPPEFSPYAVPENRQFALYFFPRVTE